MAQLSTALMWTMQSVYTPHGRTAGDTDTDGEF